ncbi:MAG: phosphate butyryltransferase [Prevotella sp.]|nr:phosphate butyryltransferase [Prevotella sp.]
MEPIVDFKILPERLRQAAQVVTVAVASPADSHTEEVIERSIAEQFARFILVANAAKADIARRLAADYPDKVTLIVADDDDAARHAVKEVREGRADVLMKGSLNTDNLLRAVLNKEEGILIKGSVLTHIAVADVPSLNHLLFFTDAAVIPYPTTEQFDALAHYITATYRSITGGDRPRVALIHCTEKVSEKFPLTLSYEELKANAAKGAYGEVDMSGPMDVKTACDAESGAIKGIVSPVVGNANCLIFPDIEAGNTFYKTLTLFGGATVAGMLVGTSAPVVVTSRADTADSKFYSLATACLKAINK